MWVLVITNPREAPRLGTSTFIQTTAISTTTKPTISKNRLVTSHRVQTPQSRLTLLEVDNSAARRISAEVNVGA